MTSSAIISPSPVPTCAHGLMVFDPEGQAFIQAGRSGIGILPVYEDRDQGRFLGLVSFEALARSGLHQHQGVATSFIARGGLTDYSGAVRLHQVGINLKGSTHDAIAYEPSLLVARLEGPVLYPPSDAPIPLTHSGSRYARFNNEHPEVPPEINLDIDLLPLQDSGVPGLGRQVIFDYAPAGGDKRMLQLHLAPGSRVPEFLATRGADFWVRGGSARFNGQPVRANAFAALGAGTRCTIDSEFGALLIAWIEGPTHWPEGTEGATSPFLI